MHARAAQEQRRAGPTQQQALARRGVHVAEGREARAGGEIREWLFQEPQDESELDELRWINGPQEGVGGDRHNSLRVRGGNERRGESSQRRELRLAEGGHDWRLPGFRGAARPGS